MLICFGYTRSTRLNMDNERMQLVSRRVMERTVKMANANVLYNVKSGPRTIGALHGCSILDEV